MQDSQGIWGSEPSYLFAFGALQGPGSAPSIFSAAGGQLYIFHACTSLSAAAISAHIICKYKRYCLEKSISLQISFSALVKQCLLVISMLNLGYFQHNFLIEDAIV